MFLKIDIEGGEYQIIDDILRFSDRITSLVIEFHEAHDRKRFCNSIKQLQTCFHIVHIHGNNCAPRSPDGLPDVLEITFLPIDSVSLGLRRTTLPLADLDSPNHDGWPDYPLTFQT